MSSVVSRPSSVKNVFTDDRIRNTNDGIMHELSIASALIDQITDVLKREGASKITSVTVAVGSLSGVDAEALQMGFSVASDGTPAQGAQLIIQKIEAKIFCKSCQKESTAEDFCFICPACQSTDIEVKAGRELKVREITAE